MVIPAWNPSRFSLCVLLVTFWTQLHGTCKRLDLSRGTSPPNFGVSCGYFRARRTVFWSKLLSILVISVFFWLFSCRTGIVSDPRCPAEPAVDPCRPRWSAQLGRPGSWGGADLAEPAAGGPRLCEVLLFAYLSIYSFTDSVLGDRFSWVFTFQ